MYDQSWKGVRVKFRYLPTLILILLIISLISCKNHTVQLEEAPIEVDEEVIVDEQEEEKSVAKETTPTIKIIDVSWNSNPGIIEITLNEFPSCNY